MRSYFILFFLASFSIAFAVREKTPQFSTAVLTKDCECESSYFAYDRLEMMTQKLQLKQDRVLGKFCKENDGRVECRVERTNVAKEGGVICPKACVTLTPTAPIKDERHVDLIEKKATEGRKAYVSQVPKVVLDALQKRFPNWIPALVRQGEFQGYEPHYDLATQFMFDREGGMTYLLFYTNSDSAQKQKLSWILVDSKTGQIHDFGDGLDPETVQPSLSSKAQLGAR